MTCPGAPGRGDSTERGNAGVLDATAGQECSAPGAVSFCGPAQLFDRQLGCWDLACRPLVRGTWGVGVGGWVVAGWHLGFCHFIAGSPPASPAGGDTR